MKLRTSLVLVASAVGSQTCRFAVARGVGVAKGPWTHRPAAINRQKSRRAHRGASSLESRPLPAYLLTVRGGAAAPKKAVLASGPATKGRQRRSAATPVPSVSSQPSTSGVAFRLKVAFYFGLWYALNVYYNIINKKLLNVLPLPWTVGSLQLGVGALYASSLWLLRLRAAPGLKDHPLLVAALRQVGFWHALGQEFSMVSLGAGPVSFTHIVKALEPLFSAAVSALWLGKLMALPVYLTLLPVVGGVGYACLQERHFSWLAFGMAMGSNLAFAFRAVLSKVAMTATTAPNLTPTNVFGLVTAFSFVFSLPMALLGEGREAPRLYSAATTAKVVEKVIEKVVRDETGIPRTVTTTHLAKVPAASTPRDLAQALFVSGLFHYLNNEVMYLALSNVHPVTLAVGNTMKRVFIMAASVLVFRNPISLQAGIGSAIGIGGVLLYSLTKQHYEQLEERAQAQTPKSSGKYPKNGKSR